MDVTRRRNEQVVPIVGKSQRREGSPLGRCIDQRRMRERRLQLLDWNALKRRKTHNVQAGRIVHHDGLCLGARDGKDDTTGVECRDCRATDIVYESLKSY